jgi:hypothetical protein
VGACPTYLTAVLLVTCDSVSSDTEAFGGFIDRAALIVAILCCTVCEILSGDGAMTLTGSVCGEPLATDAHQPMSANI